MLYCFFLTLSVLVLQLAVSSVVVGGFELRSGQAKNYNIGICCFSATAFSIKEKEYRMVGLESG
jgi:hypothetical protein